MTLNTLTPNDPVADGMTLLRDTLASGGTTMAAFKAFALALKPSQKRSLGVLVLSVLTDLPAAETARDRRLRGHLEMLAVSLR